MGQYDRFSNDPAQIAAVLARERLALAGSLEQLRRSLTPASLLDQGAALAMANLGPLTASAGGVARKNPVAAGLMAAGMGWLILGRKNAPQSDDAPEVAHLGGPDDAGPPCPSAAGRGVALMARHPFLTGALALVAGAALARALPLTRTTPGVLGPEHDPQFDPDRMAGT